MTGATRDGSNIKVSVENVKDPSKKEEVGRPGIFQSSTVELRLFYIDEPNIINLFESSVIYMIVKK